MTVKTESYLHGKQAYSLLLAECLVRIILIVFQTSSSSSSAGLAPTVWYVRYNSLIQNIEHDT